MSNRQETQQISSDLVGFHQDEIQDLNAETLQSFNPPKDDATKPCYFLSQEYRSSIVVEHIEFLLLYYHKKTLKDFNNTDFQIYTARSNSLEQQTLARLMDPGANCFNPLFYKKSKEDKYKQASKHVNQYVNSDRAKKRSDQLFEEARNNVNTLYVIVADEAHWGISDKCGVKEKKAGKKEESQEEKEANEVMGAHNNFINKWNDTDFPNVIVLQISATPYNLLTKESRLSNVSIGKVKDEDKLMIVEKERHQIFAYPNGKDDPGTKYEVTGRVGTVRDLHRIEWSYGTLDDFRGSVLVKLQIPCENKILWLSTKQDVDHEQWKLLEGTKKCSDYFLLATNNGCDMQIFTSDKVCKLVVMKKKTLQNFEVKMLPAVDCDYLSNRYDIIDNFQLVMDFGEDIIEIQCQWKDKSKRIDQMLYYNQNKQEVSITRSPMLTNNLFPDHDIKYQFILHSWRSANEQKGHDYHYLSLNHFFNSMREETQSLIRNDKHFETYKYVNKSKAEPDALLIAEYSMFVLLYQCLKEFKIQGVKYLYDVLHSQEYAVYVDKRKEKFKQFKVSLDPPSTITALEFQHVVDYYCTTAREKLYCSKNAKTNDHTKEITEAFLLNLMFNDNEDIGTLFDMFNTQHLDVSPLTESSLNELKETELHKIETYRIVKDLVVDIEQVKTLGVLQGHMKIVRVSKMEWGDRLYKTLCKARLSQLPTEKNRNYFEIIRDYGEFKLTNFHMDKDKGLGEINDVMYNVLHRIRSSMQTASCQYVSHKFETCSCEKYFANDVNHDLKCKNCGHLHKEVKQYSDLNGLPCLLVLVDKGRLGDTFPQSMTTMDLRLNNKGRSTPYLTSAIQELGRMCRYVSKNKTDTYQYPYALLGENMFKMLDDALKKSVPMYGPFVKKNRIDSRIKLDDNGCLEAKPDHFDYGNTEKHRNRILLKAEPQIGKTGVYLNVIKLLTQIIQKNNEVLSDSENEFDEGDLEEAESDEDKTDELQSYDDMEQWKVPYWVDMSLDLDLKTSISKTKYARIYGPYLYGKQPTLLAQSELSMRCQNEKRKSKPPTQQKYLLTNQQYKAFAYDSNHIKDCEHCSKQPEVVEHLIPLRRNDYNVNVRLSVPTLPQYLPVFRKLRVPGYDTGNNFQTEPEIDEFDNQKLESWIFTPTYNRYLTGNLNLNHTMVNTAGAHCSYVHVLVVRPEQYNIYCTYFKHSHCIIKLPPSLPFTKFNYKDGGVGFARFFIQTLADQLELKTYFMLDDNIPSIIDIKSRNDSYGKLARVPFFQVFSAIENQLLNRCNRPDVVKFDPYDLDSHVMNLQQYTGPCEKYGIVGIMKLRQGSTKVKRQFKKTHVTSLVCVNRKALQQKNITYKPWPVFEDMTVNNECDRNDLWVCKYMRYQMVKRNLHSNILSDIFVWAEETHLVHNREDLDRLKYPENEESQAIHWLKKTARPCTVVESCGSKLLEFTNRIRSIQCRRGNNRVIVLSELADFKHILQYDLQIIQRQTHVLFFDCQFCVETKLHCVADFQEKLDDFFEAEYTLTVLTTHELQAHQVNLVIVHVDGKAVLQCSVDKSLRILCYSREEPVGQESEALQIKPSSVPAKQISQNTPIKRSIKSAYLSPVEESLSKFQKTGSGSRSTIGLSADNQRSPSHAEPPVNHGYGLQSNSEVLSNCDTALVSQTVSAGEVPFSKESSKSVELPKQQDCEYPDTYCERDRLKPLLDREPKEEQENVEMPAAKKRKMLKTPSNPSGAESEAVSLLQEMKDGDEKWRKEMDLKMQKLLSKDKKTGEEDEFLEFVAMGLNKLKEPLKSFCKMQIQICLFNAEHPNMQQPIMATPQIPSTHQVPQVQATSPSSSLFDKSH